MAVHLQQEHMLLVHVVSVACSCCAQPTSCVDPFDCSMLSHGNVAAAATKGMPIQPDTFERTDDENAVHLHPITLRLSDRQLEARARQRQKAVSLANERRFCTANVVIGVIHTGVCVWQQQTLFLSSRGLALVVPYLALSLVHVVLCRTKVYERHRTWMSALLDTAFFCLCTFSMPHWVLGTGEAADARGYTKQFVLGSGVLIQVYLASLINKPFYECLWLLPAQMAVLTWHLAPSTCAVLNAHPYGLGASASLASRLHSWYARLLAVCPAVSQPCLALVRSYQAASCALLLGVRYVWEARVAAAGLGSALRPNWPRAPLLVKATLVGLVALHLSGCIWSWSACTSSDISLW